MAHQVTGGGGSGTVPAGVRAVPGVFPVKIREIIYTINAIESLNYQRHKVKGPAARSPPTPPQ